MNCISCRNLIYVKHLAFFCGSHIEQPILLLASNLSYFKKVYLVPWSIGRPTWLIWLGQIFVLRVFGSSLIFFSLSNLLCKCYSGASQFLRPLFFLPYLFSFQLKFLFIFCSDWLTASALLSSWLHLNIHFSNCLSFLSVTCGIGLLPFLPGGAWLLIFYDFAIPYWYCPLLVSILKIWCTLYFYTCFFYYLFILWSSCH